MRPIDLVPGRRRCRLDRVAVAALVLLRSAGRRAAGVRGRGRHRRGLHSRRSPPARSRRSTRSTTCDLRGIGAIGATSLLACPRPGRGGQVEPVVGHRRVPSGDAGDPRYPRADRRDRGDDADHRRRASTGHDQRALAYFLEEELLRRGRDGGGDGPGLGENDWGTDPWGDVASASSRPTPTSCGPRCATCGASHGSRPTPTTATPTSSTSRRSSSNARPRPTSCACGAGTRRGSRSTPGDPNYLQEEVVFSWVDPAAAPSSPTAFVADRRSGRWSRRGADAGPVRRSRTTGRSWSTT